MAVRSCTFLRLDRRKHPGCAFFRGERIHLGAYEVAVLAPVSLYTDSAVVLLGSENLLVCETGGNSAGSSTDPGTVLHL